MAAALYAQAASLLRGIDEPDPSIAGLGAAVKEGFDRASAASRLYAYDVKVSGPPEAARAFRASLVGALSKGGYALSGQSATIRMRGDISLIKGQILLDNQVYSAQGQISASQADSGDAVVSVEVQAKGLHANPLDAAVNAARDAAAQGGADLSAALSSARSKYSYSPDPISSFSDTMDTQVTLRFCGPQQGPEVGLRCIATPTRCPHRRYILVKSPFAHSLVCKPKSKYLNGIRTSWRFQGRTL